MTETAIVLPPGVDYPERAAPVRDATGVGMVVNETDLPDEVVREAIEERAGIFGLSADSFKTYTQQGGSLLARGRFRTPSNTAEEIILARDMAERDDDVRATIGACLAIAYGDGMQNTHEDEVVIGLFDKCAEHCNLDHVLQELHREWLIAGQLTTLQTFSSESFSFHPEGADRARTRTVRAPLIGVLPSEQIRVLDNDIMGTAPLFYRPATSAQEDWLREFFSSDTSAGRKAEMRRQDPLLTAMLVEERAINELVNPLYETDNSDPPSGQYVYRLNPRMAHRSTMPKGALAHPKPPMVANFALLEAKRLLNLMDFALLEGGANFLVVAKKGDEKRPGKPEEIANLHQQLRRASRTGLIVGDHRLNIEIITPNLESLLNPGKRKLLGRKIAKALLRIPDYQEEGDGGGQGVLADVEFLSRVIASDRRQIKRHVERYVYEEITERNDNVQGSASIWFPKIVLQGTEYFTNMILKLRDRGDIPRKFVVEAAGFPYSHAVQQRKREKANGDDEVMTPAPVPFDAAGNNPADAEGGEGRPAGASRSNGRAGGPPPAGGRGKVVDATRAFSRRAEQVAARYDDENGTFRVGVQTEAMIEEYGANAPGRLTKREKEALAMIGEGQQDRFTHGAIVVIPVNHEYEIGRLKAIPLASGLRAIVGRRASDNAVVTRALVGRSPDLDELAVEELAARLFGDLDGDDE